MKLLIVLTLFLATGSSSVADESPATEAALRMLTKHYSTAYDEMRANCQMKQEKRLSSSDIFTISRECTFAQRHYEATARNLISALVVDKQKNESQ